MNCSQLQPTYAAVDCTYTSAVYQDLLQEICSNCCIYVLEETFRSNNSLFQEREDFVINPLGAIQTMKLRMSGNRSIDDLPASELPVVYCDRTPCSSKSIEYKPATPSLSLPCPLESRLTKHVRYYSSLPLG